MNNKMEVARGRGGERGRVRPAAEYVKPEREALRRMEDIRRGGDVGGAGLADGVKSKRRGHLQGGR